MADESPTFPPGTMLAEMQVDLHASKMREQVTILHDRPITGLTGLEVDVTARRLDFLFGEERRALGSPLREALIPYFRAALNAVVFLVNPDTKTILSGQEVPIEIVNDSGPESRMSKLFTRRSRRR